MNVTPALAPGASVAMFVLGLLIGWLAEWAIDWFYWRGRIKNIATENTNLKERITSLEAKKNQRILSAKNVPLTDKDGNDNFQAIKGIGPVFAKRLKESGVTTFEQLSKLKSKQLEEILGTLYKRFFSKQETILAEAKEFAKQKAQNN
jgi:predicted flap endonuclease-1-like 5' DNA nuclease